jgi:two-component system, cell cycle sensor histidine kinase and response regulator CckA
MTGIGTLGWIAGALQLIVPSYAFRLVRRFGTQRVGWFVAIAFLSLALLHLLGPQRFIGARPAAGITLDFMYVVGSVLLLIGMGHIETLFSEREQARWGEESLRQQWKSRANEETAHLVRTNQELVQEISRRDLIEKALEESAAQYSFLFTENPQAMWILDLRSCRFLAANKAALRLYGFTAEELTALTGRDLMLPSAVAGFLQDVCKPCPAAESRGIWQHCRKDGTVIDVEITALDLTCGELPARLMLANDITRRRQREMELRKVHKLETIGQVAAGVAQHFSSLLTVIEGQTAALLEHPRDLVTSEHLEHISTAVTRAAGLTRQLLAAGGRQVMRAEPVDLNGLIRSMNPLLRRLIGEQIAAQVTLAQLPLVLADQHQLQHVIVNLVLNARDAMPQGGTLVLSTANVRIDEDQVESGHQGKAGDFVRLSVRDTGCGMTPQVQARLFEPFFSARTPDGGTGLGLVSAYGIVRQMGGWIEYATEVGEGTEFRVFLPCAPGAPAPGQTETKPAALVKGTILLVEAEDRVRALARFVLNRHSYRVIEADCAATALLLWQGQAANVDLVLTDENLPGDISGCELAHRLQQSRPGLKIVYTSDSTAHPDGQTPARLDGVEFIPKPYSPASLLRAVQGAMDS